MRRLALLVYLLVVLPFQMVWAAAAPVCGHETELGAKKHFGHHEHKHQSTASASGTSDASPDQDTDRLGTSHPDCESCHLGTSVAATLQPLALDVVPTMAVDESDQPSYRSHVPSGPERPDRLQLFAAARFAGGVESSPLPA